MQAKPQNPQNSQKQPSKKQFTIDADYINIDAGVTEYAKYTESGISYSTPPELYTHIQYDNTIQAVRDERFATSLITSLV